MRFGWQSLTLFFAYAFIGFALLMMPTIDRWLVEPFIDGMTGLAGFLIDIFGGRVVVSGDILRVPPGGFAVQVDNGCSGLGAVILLLAATLAFPTGWRLRLLGAAFCATAVLLVNVVRIISLFYLGQYSMAWFNWAHGYAWDVVILVDGLIAYLLWVRYVVSRASTSSAADPA
jgi:exosortase H (IPTLxxWG-CTERM-specific)